MQNPNEIESWYSQKDPWGYETTIDDEIRKQTILEALGNKKFKRALDLGAGEGWITKDLPAKELFAYELSDNASGRLPANVKRVTAPAGPYDLVILTGVLYGHYDYKALTQLALQYSSNIILTCNIKEWEKNEFPQDWLVYEKEFPYRDYTQHLCIYSITSEKK